MTRNFPILLFIALFVPSSLAQPAAAPAAIEQPPRGTAVADPPWIARGRQAVVASDSPYASAIGLDVLKAGGNAIDAAVAVSFALGVTRPYSTGLGGGGFLIVRFADGRVVVQDFRETAPAAATADMYMDAAPGIPPQTRHGYLAVAVPGVVKGRCQILAQFGTRPLRDLITPAIRLAKEGFEVDQHYVDATRKALRHYERYPSLAKSCGYVYSTHLREGRLRGVGDTLVQPALARLLEAIAESGPDYFQTGPFADALAKRMANHGGIITKGDLADYQTKTRDPILATYRDYELIAMPPPSSGGITLIEILNILETVDLRASARRNPGAAAQLQVEAMKHAFADRARHLGDSDFTAIPLSALASKDYARTLAKKINARRTTAANDYGAERLPDDSGTSHFCIVDRLGNVVVSTETINTTFGSLAAVDEWGLILNNEMDDFTTVVGQPNAFALVQSTRNAVAPGKRPLSSMAPTIVLKDGEPHLLLGASGGPRIISSVLNVLLCVTDYRMSLEQAIRQPRPHHQWLPDRVYFDAEPPSHILGYLESCGHTVDSERKTGIVQAVMRDGDGWVGASDPRKGGRPAGY